MANIPIIEEAELLDKAIADIQMGLAENIPWLDNIFGRAERLVKNDAKGRRVYTPNVYAGGNEYKQVLPDSGLGNFVFFWVDDAQDVQWEAGVSVGLSARLSIIVWFDYRRAHEDMSMRNRESIKRQLLEALNGRFWMTSGHLEITQVYELSENIFRGFSLDEVDNQFLMHPFGGFRFEGRIKVEQQCTI